MKKNPFIVLFILLALLHSSSIAQISDQIAKYRADNYGNQTSRKRGIADGNQIRTIFFNDGQVGTWSDRPSGEWPKGSGYCYLDGSALLLGAEFTAPGNLQVIHSVEGSYREEVDFNPFTGELWVLEPLPGYANPNSSSPAINNLPDTWPVSWPSALKGINDSLNGKWFGINNNSHSTGDFETFFVMDDSQDFEFTKAPYSFFPIPSDTKRGGLGLRIEARRIASSSPQVDDVLYMIYDVYNISDFNYSKAFFGLFIDSGVGGLSDGSDDSGSYSDTDELFYFYDRDASAQPGNWKTGYFGTAFLETPTNNSGNEVGLGSIAIERLSNKGSNTLWIKNDEAVWNRVSHSVKDTSLNNSNIHSILGTGLFEFNKGEQKKFVTAFIFGESINDLALNKASAAAYYKSKFSEEGFRKIPVTIQNVSTLNVLQGTVGIDWSASNYPSQDLITDMLISTDGVSFNYYKSSKGNFGTFLFETSSFPDGIFYKIKVVCYNKTEYGEFISPNYIVINNEGKAAPQLKFETPSDSGKTIRDQFKIEWISGDADSDPYTVSLYYGMKETNSWELIEKNLSSEKREFIWNTKLIPNGNSFCLKAVVKGNTDSSIVFSERFSIQNDRKFVDARLYADMKNCHGSGEFLIALIDPSQFTKDTYLVKFVKLADSTSVGYTVNNITKNINLIEPTLIIDNLESNQFDGMRLIINDDKKKEIIASQSKWISGNSNFTFSISPDKSSPSRNIYQPYDYKLTFYDANIYTTPYTKQLINMKVKNLTENKDVDCELFDNDKNGKLNAGDDIVLVEYPQGTIFKLSWRIKFNNPVSGTPIPPRGNDEYIFVSSRPFRVGDEIKFSTVNIPVGISSENNGIPSKFYLQQNFPNPFNPSTTIKYSVAQTALISIKVFDVLGREVATLVNEFQQPGSYVKTLRATSLPSGVYFYRLTAGSYAETKKMLLVK